MTTMPSSSPDGATRAWVLLVAVPFLLAAVAGCGLRDQTSQASPGETAATTPDAAASGAARGVDPVGHQVDGEIETADGRSRSYHLYVPASLPADAAAPLVIGLHGGGGSGVQFANDSQFNRIAEANGFLVVYPDGIGAAILDNLHTWNAGTCCGRAQDDHVDDVAFVSAVIDEVSATNHVDPSRVYAIGHSNGAMMAFRLACELSDKIVAVGMVSGTLTIPDCAPSHPVSMIQVNGASDDHVPIDGGEGSKSLEPGVRPPPRAAADLLASSDQCEDHPGTVVDGDFTTTTWSACDDDATIRFVVIAGSGHAWPGSAPVREMLVGTPYPNYDASYELWAFLAAHPRAES